MPTYSVSFHVPTDYGRFSVTEHDVITMLSSLGVQHAHQYADVLEGILCRYVRSGMTREELLSRLYQEEPRHPDLKILEIEDLSRGLNEKEIDELFEGTAKPRS